MRIIKPSAKLLLDISGKKMLEKIEYATRLCYKSGDRIEEGSANKLVLGLIKSGHDAMIEHTGFSAYIICDRGCCYSDDTEVLTEYGWKLWKEVTSYDKFACKSDSGLLYYAEPIKLFSYKYKGSLLAFESTSIDLQVTPNHKMWVYDYDKRSVTTRKWKFIEAELLTNGRYKFSKTAGWVGVIPKIVIPAHKTKFNQFPAINIPTEKIGDFYELLGIWITDGSYRHGTESGSGSCIQISQTKEKIIKRIYILCNNLGLRVSSFKNDHRIDNSRLLSYVEILFGVGAKTLTASVPKIIKESTPKLIQRFLDGVVEGDGSIHKKSNHIVVYTASKKFADDLQELWLKVNLSANIRTLPLRGVGYKICGNIVKSEHTQYVVSVHGARRSVPLLYRRCAKKFSEPVNYDGTVYCAEVPDHRVYVRRNGKPVWCGNSQV